MTTPLRSCRRASSPRLSRAFETCRGSQQVLSWPVYRPGNGEVPATGTGPGPRARPGQWGGAVGRARRVRRQSVSPPPPLAPPRPCRSGVRRSGVRRTEVRDPVASADPGLPIRSSSGFRKDANRHLRFPALTANGNRPQWTESEKSVGPWEENFPGPVTARCEAQPQALAFLLSVDEYACSAALTAAPMEARTWVRSLAALFHCALVCW